MSRDTTAPGTGRLFCLLLAGALVAVFAPALLAQDALMGWSIDNPSSPISLVEVNPPDALIQSATMITLVFKNNSDNVITAYELSHSKAKRTVSYYGTEYFHSKESFAPGATCSISVGIDDLAGSDHVLHFSAIIFADGTWEGDQGRVLEIGGHRLGYVTETERLKAIIEALPDADLSDTDIEAVKARIGDPPDSAREALDSVSEVRLPGLDIDSIRSADKELRRGFWRGISSGRQDALRNMNRLAELAPSAPDAPQTRKERLLFRFNSRHGFLSEMREGYRTRSARNRQLLEQNQGLLPMTGGGKEK